jgi:hypothetical protein
MRLSILPDHQDHVLKKYIFYAICLECIKTCFDPHLGFGVHMLIICAQNLYEPHKSSIFRGVSCWAGCVCSSKLIECYEFAFRKLLGEIEAEFVRNLKGLVDFEVLT